MTNALRFGCGTIESKPSAISVLPISSRNPSEHLHRGMPVDEPMDRARDRRENGDDQTVMYSVTPTAVIAESSEAVPTRDTAGNTRYVKSGRGFQGVAPITFWMGDRALDTAQPVQVPVRRRDLGQGTPGVWTSSLGGGHRSTRSTDASVRFAPVRPAARG